MTPARKRGGRGGGPSQRQLRVGELLRQTLANILERADLRDPVLAEARLTVTEVRVSPDLANATAYVVPLGGGMSDELMAALGRAAPHLRARLGEAVTLRRLPRLEFAADTSFDEAARIERLLRAAPPAREHDDDEESNRD